MLPDQQLDPQDTFRQQDFMKGLEIGKALAASSSLLELLQLKVGDKLPVPVFQSSTGSLPDGDGIFQP